MLNIKISFAWNSWEICTNETRVSTLVKYYRKSKRPLFSIFCRVTQQRNFFQFLTPRHASFFSTIVIDALAWMMLRVPSSQKWKLLSTLTSSSLCSADLLVCFFLASSSASFISGHTFLMANERSCICEVRHLEMHNSLKIHESQSIRKNWFLSGPG